MAETSITLREVQLLELEVLKVVDEICRNNNITYFLSGGTLLGAIRHQGFIPWDDDIDIMMPRPDYMRFISIATSNLKGYYRLCSIETTKSWAYPWARVWDDSIRIRSDHIIEEQDIGAFVDIFPIDALPYDRGKSNYLFKKIKVYDVLRNASRRRYVRDGEKWRILKRIIGIFTKNKSANYYAKKINDTVIRLDYNNTEYAAVSVTTQYGKKERIEKTAFSRSIEVLFEGHKFAAPIGYDEYLKNLYGDYMKLPPEEQRVSGHDFIIEKIN